MPVGLSDGTGYADSDEWLATTTAQPYRGPNLGPLSPEGTPSGTPLGTDKKPSGALKPVESTDTPEIPSSDLEDRRNESLGTMLSSWVGSQFTADKVKAILEHPLAPVAQTMTANLPVTETPLGVDAGLNDISNPQPSDVHPTPDYVNPPEGNPVGKVIDGIVKQAVDTFKIPGDVVNGTINMQDENGHISQQGIEKALDLAGLMVTGPAPVAAKLADGTLGSFMGVRSKLFDREALQQAQEMSEQGFHKDDIWRETQTFRGADGRWRQELDDTPAKLKPEAFDIKSKVYGNGENSTVVKTLSLEPVDKGPPKLKEATAKGYAEYHKALQNYVDGLGTKPVVLNDILDHPDLFKAYPMLKNIEVEPLPKEAQNRTMGMMAGHKLYLADNLSPEMALSVTMHEIQHAIQAVEDFARGGSSTRFLPKEFFAASSEYEKVKKTFTEQVRSQGIEPMKYVGAIQAELSGNFKTWNPEFQEKVKELIDEAKAKGVYEPIKNIVKSERLINKAEQEAYDKYLRLMGEVEARNVETRLGMNSLDKHIRNPMSTEDIPRKDQVDAEDIPYHQVTGIQASEPTPFRRAANENFAPGDPKRPYNIREPNMIGSKETDDEVDRMWKQFGEQQKEMFRIHDAELEMYKNPSEMGKARIEKMKKDYYKKFGIPYD